MSYACSVRSRPCCSHLREGQSVLKCPRGSRAQICLWHPLRLQKPRSRRRQLPCPLHGVSALSRLVPRQSIKHPAKHVRQSTSATWNRSHPLGCASLSSAKQAGARATCSARSFLMPAPTLAQRWGCPRHVVLPARCHSSVAARTRVVNPSLTVSHPFKACWLPPAHPCSPSPPELAALPRQCSKHLHPSNSHQHKPSLLYQPKVLPQTYLRAQIC